MFVFKIRFQKVFTMIFVCGFFWKQDFAVMEYFYTEWILFPPLCVTCGEMRHRNRGSRRGRGQPTSGWKTSGLPLSFSAYMRGSPLTPGAEDRSTNTPTDRGPPSFIDLLCRKMMAQCWTIWTGILVLLTACECCLISGLFLSFPRSWRAERRAWQRGGTFCFGKATQIRYLGWMTIQHMKKYSCVIKWEWKIHVAIKVATKVSDSCSLVAVSTEKYTNIIHVI